jgi:tRNA U34 5-carboxymethylaminomethyl modifying GTPase MnmE/TrmE
MTRDTIFSLSSGRPPAAIAVIRISGPRARDALQALTGRVPEPRRAALARVRDPNTGEVLDEALALFFPGPNSETGEDTAELQLHGGRAVITSVLDALGRLEGLRPAEAGEFTRRAFANGQLDLTEVEGLADLIQAETAAQRRQAYRHLKGFLGERAETWRARLIEALALVEAGIDFSDEADVPNDLIRPALAIARELRDEISTALAGARRGERLRDGLVVAIAGPPNAGKSTLLNRLARREAAIVSPHAGTTRDVIEVHLDLEGYPVTLLDTAGIRDSDDPVEQEGVRRARARAAEADLVLWIVDATEFSSPEALRRAISARPRAASRAQRCEDPAAQPLEETSAARESGTPQDVAAAEDVPAGRTQGGAITGSEAAAGATTFGAATAGAPDGETLRGPAPRDASASGSGPPTWIVLNKVDLLPAGMDLGPVGPDRALPAPDPRAAEADSPIGPDRAAASAGPGGAPGGLAPAAADSSPAAVNLGSDAVNAVRSEADLAPGAGTPAPATTDPEPVYVNESEFMFIPGLRISASTGFGTENLVLQLIRCAQDYFSTGDTALITRARHRESLQACRDSLARALKADFSGREEVIAEELRLAARSLGRLTGRVDVEDILDVIFRDFCIGK